MRLKRFLLQVARSPIAGLCIGWIFAHMTWAIPVKRLRETDTLIAFYHPAPSYLVHILIVPKSNRRDMKSLSSNDAEFLVELFATVQSLVDELRLPSYRLICNGGDYQEVAQLHFHLVSDTTTDAL